jgi:uroporphyrinogen-III decarboxylase
LNQTDRSAKNSGLKLIPEQLIPVDIILSPAWWYKHTGITEKWGKFGLGKDRKVKKPEVGAVHLAAGFLISEMLGCEVEYQENNPPQVKPAFLEDLEINLDCAFSSESYKKFVLLVENLTAQYGYLSGDVNWGGILNIALDLRGQELFVDMYERPDQVNNFFEKIRQVISRFVGNIQKQTGSSSVSVNRNVIHLNQPVFLHSECSHTMISVPHYEQFLFQYDLDWSRQHRPFGIHYCGEDPHRFAQSYAKLPHLDFVDVGWGGDLKILRDHLPNTFLNIRLSPVQIVSHSTTEIEQTVRRLVKASGNPWLTGVCCINMDDKVSDDQVSAIFQTVVELRKEVTGNR